MDLTSGAREFHDIDNEEEEDDDVAYKAMNWKQKALWHLKNW
jgi:amino acid transporter